MLANDDFPWDGPRCPSCGNELAPEALPSRQGLGVAYVCPEHGAVSMHANPFEVDPL